MKKFFFSMVVLALVAACGQNAFQVKGSVAEGETLPDNTVVCIIDGDKVLDSTAVAGGRFALKAPANPEKLYRIVARTPNTGRGMSWNFGVIPEKGTYKVTFAQNPASCSIEGSPVNKDYADFNGKVNELYKEYSEKASALAEDAEAEGEKLYSDLMEKVKGISLETIGKNAGNYIAKGALSNIIYDLPLDELKSVVAKCGKFIRDDESIARIIACKEAELATVPGQPFVDFAGKTPDGEDVRLSDYVGKGKWVLTDFWASWCGPCMGEIPNIKKVYEAFEGDDFMVLGIAVWETDGDNTASAECMEKRDMKWHQIFVGDDKTPTDSYGILGIPTMILFAPDGTIYKREGLRGEAMYKSVAEALGK
ncbi:MAG: AhpC/TSA family protein [Bacteroidales bacterium]|nr:AhpC/TSA family protein [Bacteroidales bacterium]